MPSIDWQHWQTAAFLDAQRRRRPVLLLLEAAWAPACLAWHETVLARPDVVAAVAASVVPVRVDVDRRPDIADRYGLGHWPSLVFLTPEGDVLTGGTHVDESLGARVRDIARAFAAADGRWDGPDATRTPARPADPGGAGALDAVRAAIDGTRDPVTGACLHDGVPSPGAALFALAHAAVTGDDAWGAVAADTIDALPRLTPGLASTGLVVAGPDAERQGVARLEAQAEWVRVLARAVRAHPLPAWSTRLAAMTEALLAFRRADGHWRPWTGDPALVLTDASARACRALLAAAQALDRSDYARAAVEALEVLAPAAYVRASGVAHVIEQGRARGPMRLDDAVLLAHALIDADAWRPDDVYRELGEELIRTTLVRLTHDSGALVDRVSTLAGAGQVGRLADPFHPLEGNADAARLLCRVFVGEAAQRERALAILHAVSAEAATAGVFAAPVGLAWHALGSAGQTMAAW